MSEVDQIQRSLADLNNENHWSRAKQIVKSEYGDQGEEGAAFYGLVTQVFEGLKKNELGDNTPTVRWTSEQAAQWAVRHTLQKSFGESMDKKYPGGRWVTMNGQHIYLTKDGQIAKETLPKISEMKNQGSGSHLGGAGKKDIFTDDKGRQYIFKPAESKGGQREEFRAHVQTAVSNIASRIFKYGDHIPVHTDRIKGGKLGSVQPLVPGVMGNLKELNWKSLTPQQIQDIQREHVLDWTVGNFDSHAGNFILTEQGKVLGVDKEQAFRYSKDKGSHHMSLDYHPNAQYGEQEPLYNTMYREYAKGKVDLDLTAVDSALDKLKAIPDQEYRKMLKPYADSLKLPESFYTQAIERKNNAGNEFKSFFAKLTEQRRGTQKVKKNAQTDKDIKVVLKK